MHFLVSARANCEPKRRYHRFFAGTILTLSHVEIRRVENFPIAAMSSTLF